MHEELSREFSLDGRVAVITGAASGIGREAARVLAQAGASVVLADVDEAGLAETTTSVRSFGVAALARPVDVTQRAEVELLADETVRAMGRLDVWVNAAGVLLRAPILEVFEADLDRVLAINLKGTFWGCAAAGRAMQPQGSGSIVNISSAGADSAASNISVYAMSKSAVSTLARACAMEFGAFGVRANAIAPGWIDTPMVSYRYRNAAGEIDPDLREATLRQTAKVSPLGVTGTPRDIALAILYLASDASRFVTGQVLRPNGGSAMPL